MYVAIDRENLVFLNKHPDIVTLSYVSEIENPDVPISFFLCSTKHFLSNFSAWEMLNLYKNTTGQEVKIYNEQMKKVLLDMVFRMPLLDADYEEAAAQWEWVQDKSWEDDYRYVRGSMVPRKTTVLFPRIKLERSVHEHALMTTDYGKLVADYFPSVAAEETVPAALQAHKGLQGTGTLPEGQKRSSAPASAPREGTVTGSIWAAAEVLWEQQNRPTDKESIKGIRKAVIAELTHINSSTLSVQLSAWAKTKLF